MAGEHVVDSRLVSTHHLTDDHSLAHAWESVAPEWIEWARAPQHDSYWRYHRDLFLELLPPPPLKLLDLGCGEGRLPRDLKALGYEVSGVDCSTTMVAAAIDMDPSGEYRVADAGDSGYADASFDAVVAFLSLHDVDHLDAAVAEVARVLRADGRLCMALIHPLNSAGPFDSSSPDAHFRLDGPYLRPRKYEDTVERGDYRMRFVSAHRPFGAYFESLERHGLLVERVREIPDGDPSPIVQPGQRYLGVPLFLHVRAVKHRVP